MENKDMSNVMKETQARRKQLIDDMHAGALSKVKEILEKLPPDVDILEGMRLKILEIIKTLKPKTGYVKAPIAFPDNLMSEQYTGSRRSAVNLVNLAKKDRDAFNKLMATIEKEAQIKNVR